MDGDYVVLSGPQNCPAPFPTVSALNGYPLVGASNVSNDNVDTWDIQFNAAGVYDIEIDYCQWENEQELGIFISGQTVTPGGSSTAAIWTGGKLHGTVKSGNIPLPGVTVTAQNSLTGKRYSTTTDITGAWQMNIPP